MFAVRSTRSDEVHRGIELDINRRELRKTLVNSQGKRKTRAVYRIDDLEDLTIRGRFLTAKDTYGRVILEMPMRNRADEESARTALAALA